MLFPVVDLEPLAQVDLGAVQPDAHGIGCHAEGDRDLGGRESLPGPQRERLGLGWRQPGHGVTQGTVVDDVSGLESVDVPGRVDDDEPGHEGLAAVGATSGVGQAAPGDPVRPRQRRIRGDLRAAAPQDEEDVAEDVGRGLAVRPAHEVGQEGRVQLGDEELEAVGVVDGFGGGRRRVGTGHHGPGRGRGRLGRVLRAGVRPPVAGRVGVAAGIGSPPRRLRRHVHIPSVSNLL